MSKESEAARPLSDVRVLDISNLLAAPMASMYLADFGADVLKVEKPGTGDEIRYWGENKNGVGLYFKLINRGKKAITLDLRTPFGVEVVKRLVKDVDVVIENYRTGTLEKWGIGYETLSAINPGLIMARVTGFGQTGPYKDRPGFGTLAEAYSGFAYINGFPDRPPLLPSFGLADATTSLMGAFLIMVAVNEKRRTGKGQMIDLALYETLLTMLGPQVVNFNQLGIVQERAGSRLPFTAPRNTYQTKDGLWVAMAGSQQSTFQRICAALDRNDLLEDERFATSRARLANAADLDVELQRSISTFDREDILKLFMSLDATISPVNNVADVLADEHVMKRGNIVAVHDEEIGDDLQMQGVVGKLSRTPGKVEWTGPRMGQHNREILIDRLGYSEQQLLDAGLTVPADGERSE